VRHDLAPLGLTLDDPLPHVLLIGVAQLMLPIIGESPWRLLRWVGQQTHRCHVAVWFESAQNGPLDALHEHGVTGMVQWADATTKTWPQLVAIVSVGSTYWSRPFDALERRRKPAQVGHPR